LRRRSTTFVQADSTRGDIELIKTLRIERRRHQRYDADVTYIESMASPRHDATRLRVLIASRGVLPIGPGAGGAELVTFQLAKALVARGHSVTLIADVDSKHVALPAGLRVIPVGMAPLRALVLRFPRGFARWMFQHLMGNLAVGRRIRRELHRSREGFDVIHCHGALSAIRAKAAAVSVPVVYTEHDATPWMCQYRRWWERLIRKAIYRALNVTAFRRVDRIVTNFDLLAQELTTRWGISRERVASIQNAIDIDSLSDSRAGVLSVSEQLGIGSYCLFVGSLDLRKSPDILLRALSDAPGITCVFVGDGPARHRIRQLAMQLGVADRIHMAGHLRPTELGRYYAGADLLILPSVSESSPLVILEAMACGTPVVASRVGGIPAIVEDWKTGFLVKPGDVGQLTMCLRFLTEDRPRLQRMGEEARKRVLSSMWPEVLDHYVGLYEALSGVETAPQYEQIGRAASARVPVDLAGLAMDRERVEMRRPA
jgi:glycosyltransferase involved in cell wall biosynthesis